MSASGPEPRQRPRARPTGAFYVVLAIAAVCAVTMVVARTGTVAEIAFAGLAISLFVLLNALIGVPRRPRPRRIWLPGVDLDRDPRRGESDRTPEDRSG